MKLPSLQFYPGDWLRDSVSGCSLAAQGLWLRMLLLMHDSERYGYLSLNGSAIPSEQIARRCACSLDEYESLLAELESAGVPSRSQNGTIYSRRMVRDAEERAKAAARKRKERGHGSVTAPVTPPSQPRHPPSSSSPSVPNGTGAAAPDFSDPAVMWDVGKALLIKNGMSKANAGKLLGKLASDHGKPKLAAALAQTVTANAANPKDYLVAVLTREQKPRSQAEINRAEGGFVH